MKYFTIQGPDGISVTMDEYEYARYTAKCIKLKEEEELDQWIKEAGITDAGRRRDSDLHEIYYYDSDYILARDLKNTGCSAIKAKSIWKEYRAKRRAEIEISNKKYLEIQKQHEIEQKQKQEEERRKTQIFWALILILVPLLIMVNTPLVMDYLSKKLEEIYETYQKN